MRVGFEAENFPDINRHLDALAFGGGGGHSWVIKTYQKHGLELVLPQKIFEQTFHVFHLQIGDKELTE